MNDTSRFILGNDLNLSIDNTSNRVVLTRCDRFPDGELATWLQRKKYQRHETTKAFSKKWTSQDVNDFVDSMENGATQLLKSGRRGGVILFVVALPEAGGVARLRCMLSGNTSGPVSVEHLGELLNSWLPTGSWKLFLYRISLPQADKDIMSEISAFRKTLLSTLT